MTTADGHSYEHKGIKVWLAEHDTTRHTSPLTGATLDHKMVLLNHGLRQGAEEWRSASQC